LPVELEPPPELDSDFPEEESSEPLLSDPDSSWAVREMPSKRANSDIRTTTMNDRGA
jgi:hypothetical protein